MLIARLVGMLLAALGAGLIGGVWYYLNHPSDEVVQAIKVGVFGVVLLAPVGAAVLFFGAHLLLAPRSAAKVWRVGRRRPAQSL